MQDEVNSMIKTIRDTVEHKKIVMDNCLILSEYLIRNGKTELGLELLKRGSEHDISKFSISECLGLGSLSGSNKSFKEPLAKLSESDKDIIREHWKVNRHHPEYYEIHKEEMKEIDMLEMVCDWYARSKQYGTDFIPFIVARQGNRFKIDNEKFDVILKWSKILKSLDEDTRLKCV